VNGDQALAATALALVAVLVLPFLAFAVAAGIDLSYWAFTGHELLPWISHALNSGGHRS
jgi:hypothetical protein